MSARDTIKQIQALLGTKPDGVVTLKPAGETLTVFCALALSDPDAPWPVVSDAEVHEVWATSFADPADVAAYRQAKAEGMSDEQAFRVGDNGIGFTGLDCTDESRPYVALPWEDWHDKFGSAKAAENQPVLVTLMGIEHECLIGDTMPHRAHIENGAGLDLAPGARKLWGLSAPLKIKASWRWP